MKPLNLIVICSDTFRRDHLGCYGSKDVETPHLDVFAKVSARFTNAYGEALPTIEARKVYFTGRSLLPYAPFSGLKDLGPRHRGWEPIDNPLVTMAEILKERGYKSALVTDCLHYQKPNMNYHRAFDFWEFIRGQESDRWAVAPSRSIHPRDHIQEHLAGASYERVMGQYLANTAHWRSEEDTFCAQVARRASSYVEDMAALNQPVFLWADFFDPHEPWDAPKQYLDRYWNKPIPTPGRYLFGYGCPVDNAREADMPLLKACYAAEVTLTDRWIGHLLETIRRCGMYENSVIVFTTDHGTSLYEHGFVQKECWGLYAPMTGLPLLVHHPPPPPPRSDLSWKNGRRPRLSRRFLPVLPFAARRRNAGGTMQRRRFLADDGGQVRPSPRLLRLELASVRLDPRPGVELHLPGRRPGAAAERPALESRAIRRKALQSEIRPQRTDQPEGQRASRPPQDDRTGEKDMERAE